MYATILAGNFCEASSAKVPTTLKFDRKLQPKLIHNIGPSGHLVPEVRGARRVREVVLRHQPRGHPLGRGLGENLRPQPAPPVAQNPQKFRLGKN
jgi:hypothetical protein